MNVLFRAVRFAPLALAPVLWIACQAAGDETLAAYARAKSLYDDGDLAGAAALLDHAAGARRFPPALVLRGKTAYFSDNPGDAEARFRRALKLSPSNAEAGLYLARVLRETGRGAEARAVAERLLADDPSDLRVLRLCAVLALDKGRAGEAEASAFLDRAAEASSEAALVFLERARVRWTAGNGGAALEDLDRAAALSGASSPIAPAARHLQSAISAAISAEISAAAQHGEQYAE